MTTCSRFSLQVPHYSGTPPHCEAANKYPEHMLIFFEEKKIYINVFGLKMILSKALYF